MSAGTWRGRFEDGERRVIRHVLTESLTSRTGCDKRLVRRLLVKVNASAVVELDVDDREILHHLMGLAHDHPERFGGWSGSGARHVLIAYIGRVTHKLPPQGAGTYGRG